MSVPSSNGTTPALYELRHFKCYNWHNLTTQEGPLEGNVFNLGDVGTGKTTWMEGVQAALVLGEPRMRWNSAASQGVSVAEQEDGRDLLTIVLRYQQMAKEYKRANGVSYFALELTDEKGGNPLTIGIGASAASPLPSGRGSRSPANPGARTTGRGFRTRSRKSSQPEGDQRPPARHVRGTGGAL